MNKIDFIFWQVRDIYDAGDFLVLITTDRLSAFDRNLASIPFKGQVLCVFFSAVKFKLDIAQCFSRKIISLCCLTFRFLTRPVCGGSITHST